jgi:hypothetical protein
MLKFKVNEYITLALQGEVTIIYVDGKEFMVCKALLLTIPTERIQYYDNIKSIDEAIEVYEHYKKQEAFRAEIPPEAAFWGHCSNLQVWSEHDYDTQILSGYLAFPLLKKLTEVGDLKAKKVFKEEIVKRLMAGNYSTNEFLRDRGYIDLLSEDDIRSMLPVEEVLVLEELEKELNIKFEFVESAQPLTDPICEQGNYYYAKNYSIVGLRIYYACFERVPDIIGELKALKYLNLSDNDAKFIPESIGSLRDLEFLDLSDNKFEQLPEQFKNLTSLRIFHIVDNNLKEMPLMIKGIDSLEVLSIRENPINNYPEKFGNLKKDKDNDYLKNIRE